MQIEKKHMKIEKKNQFHNTCASNTETRCKSSQHNQIQKRAANNPDHNGNLSRGTK